jgi:hypothetical protein
MGGRPGSKRLGDGEVEAFQSGRGGEGAKEEEPEEGEAKGEKPEPSGLTGSP